MKTSIEIREPDAEGKHALRLTYYASDSHHLDFSNVHKASFFKYFQAVKPKGSPPKALMAGKRSANG